MKNLLTAANNTEMPRDGIVTGTYYGRPFEGRIRDSGCRWVCGTFIYSVETTAVSPEFAAEYGDHRILDFYATPREVAMGHGIYAR